MATREQILTTLFELLQTAGEFKSVGRRLVAPENITPALSPALFLVSHSDLYKRDIIAAPPKRDLYATAVIYNDVGTGEEAVNLIPETAINNAIDAMDGMFKGEDALHKFNTLGGLVYACFIEGEILRGSGDVNGKSSAYIPIRIILP